MVKESILQKNQQNHNDSESVRPIDPNVRQWAASNPLENVWVSASAGTGKTKVLTDRVLRLLLPRENGSVATEPHRILCLTYTKAAASEMTLRINKTLGKWAIMTDEDLEESLRKTMGYQPNTNAMASARRLFASVVDTPGGLKIMTIHAFCQSLLGRFPLEAGITPHMSILEDFKARELIRSSVIELSASPAFYRLSVELPESALMSALQSCLSDSDQLIHFFDTYTDKAAQVNALEDVYGVSKQAQGKSAQDLQLSFIHSLDTHALKALMNAFFNGSKTDQARANALDGWLASGEAEKLDGYTAFKNVFLTQKGEPRKTVSVGALKAMENADEVQNYIAAEIIALEDTIKARMQADLTYDLLEIAIDVQVQYSARKHALGALDYNDLLLKTLGLLKRAKRSVPWVLYKLDGGLDHILLDEAQDTNPVQWEMISLLVEEFFGGDENQDAQTRTLFVVGDEKQSIYRFQGASLEDFQYMRDSLADRAIAARAKWRGEALQMSFRSTRSVLGFVDAAFKDAQMYRDIGVPEGEVLEHFSWRSRQAGRVELWPLIEAEEIQAREPWELPVRVKDIQSPKALLAEKIAETIEGWLKHGRVLPSKNRCVRAGDIMVLVRSRSQFVELLIRALKKRSIAVNGADRLVLDKTIAVQDLISLVKFALQPHDDLSLAEILKSPFIGMFDGQLEDLAYERKNSLWEQVSSSNNVKIIQWLKDIKRYASASPFAFFTHILNMPCPADAISGFRAMRGRLGEDCIDAIDEFLASVQNYEIQNTVNLQAFLLWQQKNPIEIKREQDAQEDSVRIMTVHGAKGLQAPIVFLPDLLRTKTTVSAKVPRLIFPRRSGASVPIWSPRKTYDCNAYTKYLDKISAQETAEYKRLFYVAATRAEDELILCEAKPKITPDEESWYNYAAQAFEYLAQIGKISEGNNGVRVYAHGQIGDPDDAQEEEHAAQKNALEMKMPEWLYRPPPPEPPEPRPLRPSRPSESDTVVVSPLNGNDEQYRFLRGNLTHTLLQFLPDLPKERHITGAQAYLKLQAPQLSADMHQDIMQETLDLMKNEAFRDIFSPAAQSEVSLSGLLPSGQLISGQIDRMLVTEDAVLIVDYKTNRPPPERSGDIPLIYRNQMMTYKQALEAIYPDKVIKCALLWTYNAQLMQVDV